ncbi:MAG: redoxin domain-containing protein [Candidatus Mycalebacterium zealandia]|nr:MAG: redoxin domain-containing protein [Candidatus Mycalebacterium zealandia]
MRIIKRTLAAAVIAIVAVLIVWSFNKRFSPERGNWPESPLVGRAAPAFSLTTFDGKTLELSDFAGKPVVFNFWASWCLPCADEVGDLNRAEKKYGGEVVFIGINVMDDINDAIEFAAKHNTTYTNAYDPEKTVHIDYGVAGVPETFFISPDGKIWNKITGPATYPEISKILASIPAKQN